VTLRAVIALAAAAAPIAAAAPPASLCTSEETVYFECTMASGELLAICGTLPESLQYRFGRPGAIELAYPAVANEGPKALLLARYHRYRTDRVALRFEREGVSYTVFDDQEEGRRRGGVEVKTADARVHERACTGQVASRLGELIGVVACDRESALAGGTCP